jgi:hypothetical protein
LQFLRPISKPLTALKIVALAVAACSFISACTTTQKTVTNPSPVAQQVDKTMVVLSQRDIPAGVLIESNAIYKAFTTNDAAKIPADHMTAMADVVGKLSARLITPRQVICPADLVEPTQPKPGEKWLINYSTADLLSRVDTDVSIKGVLTDWVIGGDHKPGECAILSADQMTYVRIGLPCEFSRSNYTLAQRRAAAAQRVSLLKEIGVNNVVIASGKLYRCETSSIKASRNYLIIDQGTLKMVKSAWR